MTIEISLPYTQSPVFTFYGYNYFSGDDVLGFISGGPEAPWVNVDHHCCSLVRENGCFPHSF